jgi:hypothetical protein
MKIQLFFYQALEPFLGEFEKSHLQWKIDQAEKYFIQVTNKSRSTPNLDFSSGCQVTENILLGVLSLICPGETLPNAPLC